MRLIIILGFIALAIFAFKPSGTFLRKDKLSEYGFFTGHLSDLNPVEGVVPYSVNTPLFSNYAEKLRFIKIPNGEKAVYNDSSSFSFPVGTVLIKNFYFPNDFRNPKKGRKILETRLLVHQPEGWQAYPYIWNDEQTEAFYDPAGEMKTVTFVNQSGKKISAPYLIPNKNQCKGCHTQNNQFSPIGTSARQLNKIIEGKGVNQLFYWREKGIITDVPHDVPRLAVWNDETTGSLNDRARAYLDANCGHCHSKKGPASTSGLFLDIYEKDMGHLGVHKAPVAAGRGAGNLQYDIVPGDPNQSILVFRMNTNDPAIAMPEIGREQIHAEGVKLIEEWIRKNNFVSH